MTLLTLIHIILSVYIIFGGIFAPNLKYVKIHFYFTFIVMLHWITNDGKCFLTQMNHDTSSNPSPYVESILNSFGINTNKHTLETITWSSIIMPCLHSYYRLRINDIDVF